MIDLDAYQAAVAHLWEVLHPDESISDIGNSLAEESGEVNRAIIKRKRGSSRSDDWDRDLRHESIDLLVNLLAVAWKEGYSLGDQLVERWPRYEAKWAGGHHLQVGDRVIVDFTGATFGGREGAITAIHPDSPAAEVEGCPILDIMLDGEEPIIIPAKAVRRLRPPTCPACFGKGRVEITCELCGGSGSYDLLTPPDMPPVHRTPRPSITCPRCNRTSHNANDIANGYCGNCHDWTSRPGDDSVVSAVGADRRRIWAAIQTWEESAAKIDENGFVAPIEGFTFKPLEPFFGELRAIVFDVSDRERSVLDNPELLASIERGMADAAAGRVRPWSELAHKLDDEPDIDRLRAEATSKLRADHMCTSGDHSDVPAVGDAWGGDEEQPDQRCPYCAECLTVLGSDFDARWWEGAP
jgi:NTP pyrophosphatase (non-canonical NTP hydrolase)